MRKMKEKPKNSGNHRRENSHGVAIEYHFLSVSHMVHTPSQHLNFLNLQSCIRSHTPFHSFSRMYEHPFLKLPKQIPFWRRATAIHSDVRTSTNCPSLSQSGYFRQKDCCLLSRTRAPTVQASPNQIPSDTRAAVYSVAYTHFFNGLLQSHRFLDKKKIVEGLSSSEKKTTEEKKLQALVAVAYDDH